jgi:hypothetical protein
VTERGCNEVGYGLLLGNLKSRKRRVEILIQIAAETHKR